MHSLGPWSVLRSTTAMLKNWSGVGGLLNIFLCSILLGLNLRGLSHLHASIFKLILVNALNHLLCSVAYLLIGFTHCVLVIYIESFSYISFFCYSVKPSAN